MSSPALIRRLGPGDSQAYRRLMTLFGDVFADPNSYERHPPDGAWVSERLADPTLFLLVAEHGSEIVGGLAAYELKKFERRRSEIYIYDLAVAHHSRRQGIATALIDETRRLAELCGAHTVFVQADPPDAEAVALYTKLGRCEEVLHFDIPVPEAKSGQVP